MTMENYEIRFCKVSEFPILQRFIDKYWKKNHILSKNKKLLDWQYFDETQNKYNFVVAYNKIRKNFDAILGFIPTYKFDPKLKKNRDIWLAIWKLQTDTQTPPGLGFIIYQYLLKEINPRSIGSIGINDNIKHLYKKLNFKLGDLQQYYLINPYKKNYEIIQAPKNTVLSEATTPTDYEIKEIDLNNTQLQQLMELDPRKSVTYYQRRYRNHPSYHYLAYGIFEKQKLILGFLLRVVTVEQNSCLRIVEIIGDPTDLPNLQSLFTELINSLNAEYLDILTHGMNERALIQLGFKKQTPEVTLPNYFEPFVRENKIIAFAYKSDNEPYTIFKGDSDQDRPNV